MAQLNRRPQVQPFGGAVGIQPGPIQSDLYTPPEQRVAGTKAAALAQALGGFNQALVTAGNYFSKGQYSEDGADVEAARIMAGQSQQAWSEAVRSGQLPAIENPWVRMAVERSAGEMRGTEWMNSVQDRINSGEIDVTSTDMDALLTGLMQQELDALEGAPQHVQQGFMASTANFRNWGIELQQGELAEQANQERYQTVFNEFSMTGQQLLATPGITPQQFAQQMHGQYGNLNSTLFLSNGELDGELMNYAASIATTHPDFAIELLTGTRTGADGSVIPPISSKREAQSQVAAIVGAANRAINVRNVDTMLDGVTTQNVTLMAQGTPLTAIRDFTYTDENGRTQTYTRQSQLQDAWEAYQTQRGMVTNRSTLTAEATFIDDLRIVTTNGIEHTQWKDILEGVPGSINDTTLSNPGSLDNILRAVKLYEDLNNQAPTYLGSLVTDETRDFFDVYLVAKNEGGMDDTTALNYAYNTAVRGTTTFITPSTLRDQVVDQVAVYANRWFSQDLTVEPGILTSVYNLAHTYMESGAALTEEDAVRSAIATVSARSTEVNGYRINDMGIPFISDFKPIAEDFITDVYDNFLRGIYPDLEKGDIQMYQTANGVFQLRDASTGTPLMVDANGDGQAGIIRFNLESLATFRERQVHTIQEEIVETQNARQAGMLIPDMARQPLPTADDTLAQPFAPRDREVPGQAAPAEQTSPVQAPEPEAAAAGPVEFTVDERAIEGNVEADALPAQDTPEWNAARAVIEANPITRIEDITRENFYAMMIVLGKSRLGLLRYIADEMGWSTLDVARQLNSLRPN